MSNKNGLDISPLTLQIIEGLIGNQKPLVKTKKGINVGFVGIEGQGLTADSFKEHAETLSTQNPIIKQVLVENKKKDIETSLSKSMSNFLDGMNNSGSIQRLAYTSDPKIVNRYQTLYKRKVRFLPEDILKRLSVQDNITAAILQTRAGQVSQFSRPQPDRFSTGFKIDIVSERALSMTPEQRASFNARVNELEKKILNCGHNPDFTDPDVTTFNEFLAVATKNALVYGRIAVEIIYNGFGEFQTFRLIDTSTIFRVAGKDEMTQSHAKSLRKEALRDLRKLNKPSLDVDRLDAGEYEWIQVINGQPEQAFTKEEVVCHNFYPTTDIEMDGYPITPLDTIMQSVVTHINIMTHNRLYFQNGRAARGMVVIQSDDADESVVANIRQQFNASVNGVNNAWRMPVLGIGQEDKVTWNPMDISGRDAEFQYLSDSNAREILAAFQMSPDEIPGYSHLSKGSAGQTLSESNNEFKLEAHRDAGIRPLLSKMQDFINQKLIPILDPELAKICVFKFVGLDVETSEKESERFVMDMGIHLTMDEVLQRVNKNPLGKQWAGEFPLNEKWQQGLYQNVPVGMIMEHFFNIPGAAADPRYNYIRDPFFFQNWQYMQTEKKLKQAEQQMAMQQQMDQQAMMQGGDMGGDQGGMAQPPTEDVKIPGYSQDNRTKIAKKSESDYETSIGQLTTLLAKGEAQLTPEKRRLIAQQENTVKQAIRVMEQDSKKMIEEILEEVGKNLPKHKKKE